MKYVMIGPIYKLRAEYEYIFFKFIVLILKYSRPMLLCSLAYWIDYNPDEECSQSKIVRSKSCFKISLDQQEKWQF